MHYIEKQELVESKISINILNMDMIAYKCVFSTQVHGCNCIHFKVGGVITLGTRPDLAHAIISFHTLQASTMVINIPSCDFQFAV